MFFKCTYYQNSMHTTLTHAHPPTCMHTHTPHRDYSTHLIIGQQCHGATVPKRLLFDGGLETLQTLQHTHFKITWRVWTSHWTIKKQHLITKVTKDLFWTKPKQMNKRADIYGDSSPGLLSATAIFITPQTPLLKSLKLQRNCQSGR